MNDETIDVLLVEDNPQEAEIVRLYLAKKYTHQYAIRHVRSVTAALAELTGGRAPSVILLDLHLPDTKGLEGFRHIAGAASDVPVIILTNFNEESTAASAVRNGAQDYLIKREVNAALLHRAILYAIERHRAEQALLKVKERYALAVAGANDCIWDWDATTDRAYFSPRWNELIGLSHEVKVERLQDWFERVHPEDVAELRRLVRAKPHSERHRRERQRFAANGDIQLRLRRPRPADCISARQTEPEGAPSSACRRSRLLVESISMRVSIPAIRRRVSGRAAAWMALASSSSTDDGIR